MKLPLPAPIRVLLLACALPAAAAAQVTFSFDYTDASGTGFNDTALGATRQAALQSAANTLAGYFSGYTATVTFTVSTNNSGGYLASAGSSTSYSVDGSGNPIGGFYQTSAQKAILGNTTGTGTINWNFSYTWDYDNAVASNAYDFKSVAMHEMLHTLGFFSWINASNQGAANRTSGTADVWSPFDQYLTNASGTRLVDSSGQFNTALSTILTDGASSDVYFSGTHAMAANGNSRVHLYSPATYAAGSSLSHLDTSFYGTNNYIMTHAVGTGQSLRTLSAVELGILQDIGYTVSAVPEPASYALSAGALALLFSARRRRGA